jgi:hypothetical protein
VAVGHLAGASVTTGIQNTLVGGLAGDALTDADLITAVGYAALTTDTLGSNSTALGYGTLSSQNFTTATNSYNVAVGSLAGNQVTTGRENTLIGGRCGDSLTTGTGNTLVGQNATVDSVSRNVATVLGSDLASHAQDNTFRVKGDNGVYNTANTSTWNTTSDERIKKNIVDSSIGLSELNQIRVRNFEYRTASEITASELQEYNLEQLAVNKTGTQIGCIAQELEAVIPSAIIEDDRGVKNVQSDELLWHAIKSVQELSAQVTALTARSCRARIIRRTKCLKKQ